MDSHLLTNKGYGNSLGIGQRPALLVSDMQNAYVDPDYARGMDASQQIIMINKLIQLFRQHGRPIFFSSIAFDEVDIKQPNLWLQKIHGLSDLQVNSSLVNIHASLDFEPGSDKLITKQYPSVFFATAFAALLNNQQIDTLVITGCSTSGCVRTSAIDCLQHGFRPIVIADAVADRWPEAHQQALLELQAKYADVMTSEELLTRL